MDSGNDITEDLDATFLFKILESEADFSPVSQHSQSKGDVFGLQEMLDDTPLTRDKLISEQESDGKVLVNRSCLQRIPVSFYKNQGVLMRKWRFPGASVEDEWQIKATIKLWYQRRIAKQS